MFRFIVLSLLLTSSVQAATVSISDGQFTTQDGRLYYTDPTPEWGSASNLLGVFSLGANWSIELPVHIDEIPILHNRSTAIGLRVTTKEYSLNLGADTILADVNLYRDYGDEPRVISSYITDLPMSGFDWVSTRQPYALTDAVVGLTYSSSEHAMRTRYRTPDGDWMISSPGRVNHWDVDEVEVSIFAQSQTQVVTLGQVYAIVPEPAIGLWLAIMPLVMRRVR